MGRCVMVAYRPKPGKAAALRETVRKHLDVLRAEGLVTDRPGWVLRAGGGVIVEVFEWRSHGAIDEAHANRAVQALWEEFAAVCEYVPLAELPETKLMFAEFDTLEP